MTRLAFVTPAHGRPAMTAICLEQRRRVCSALAERGVDATCVVVGDDDNLRVADRLGFHTLRQQNRPMGRKWNDGIQHACTTLGADYVVPIGTDDWVHPDYFTRLPPSTRIHASRSLCLVSPDGGELVRLGPPRRQAHPIGFIPWVIPAGVLRGRGDYRPAREELNTGFDGSVWHSAKVALPRLRFEVLDDSPLQIVDFKSPLTQITGYDLTVRANPVEDRTDAPFERLAERFPHDLVDRMQKLYQENAHG